jgi:tetratricopeptide (TPR) repeat protein
MGFFCLMNAKRAGLAFDERREIVTVSKLTISDELSYEGDTPVETDRLVRSLREVGNLWSTSTNFDPNAQDSVSLFFSGKREEFERQCRQAVDESPDDMGQLKLLIEVLRGNKKAAEAKSFALRATIAAPNDPDSWVTLGGAEKDLEDYATAISHLQKALALDPLKREALVSLFLCYEKTGDAEKAHEIWSRLEALGGPMLST